MENNSYCNDCQEVIIYNEENLKQAEENLPFYLDKIIEVKEDLQVIEKATLHLQEYIISCKKFLKEQKVNNGK